MKIPRLLALAAAVALARGMTDDNDPPPRILEKASAAFGDAAHFLINGGFGGGSASVEDGTSQGDENAHPNPRILNRVSQYFGDAATSLGDVSLGSLLASPSQQNEASDDRNAKRLCVRPGADGECEAEDRKWLTLQSGRRATLLGPGPPHRPGFLEIELDENDGPEGEPFAVRLVKPEFVTFDADDDVEEEVDGRQKVRIDDSGRIARVVEFRAKGWLLVELDGPELELDTTRTTHVTFLDEDDKEMAYGDVRRPFEPKLITGGQRARTKFEDKLDAWGAVHLVDGEKTTLPSFEDKVFDWCKVDTTNYKDIPVEQAPMMDISRDVFEGDGRGRCGRGNTKERQKLYEYLLDLRKRRENDHKETLKQTHHLEKGFDELYDPETNSHRYGSVEWFAGSGRWSVWRAVSKKIKEVDALSCPHTNTLASADVHRDECPTGFFHDLEFKNSSKRALSKD